MKYLLIISTLLIILGGLVFYMEKNCILLYHRVDTLILVQGETGIHEKQGSACVPLSFGWVK